MTKNYIDIKKYDNLITDIIESFKKILSSLPSIFILMIVILLVSELSQPIFIALLLYGVYHSLENYIKKKIDNNNNNIFGFNCNDNIKFKNTKEALELLNPLVKEIETQINLINLKEINAPENIEKWKKLYNSRRYLLYQICSVNNNALKNIMKIMEIMCCNQEEKDNYLSRLLEENYKDILQKYS